jgi:hypothetical protein
MLTVLAIAAAGCELMPLPGDWSDVAGYVRRARSVGLTDDELVDDLCDRYGWHDVELDDLSRGVIVVETEEVEAWGC